jgi:hypothetical protein
LFRAHRNPTTDPGKEASRNENSRFDCIDAEIFVGKTSRETSNWESEKR